MKAQHSDHWINGPDIFFGHVRAYGVSEWDLPANGRRLRTTCRRHTLLRTVEEMERWAKKYGLDARQVEQATVIWQKLVTPEVP